MANIIFGDHGDHGNFLQMSLHVLLGKSKIFSKYGNFDLWEGGTFSTGDQNSSNLFHRSQKNFLQPLFDKEDFLKKKTIWIYRDQPLLWAYNLITRSVLNYMPWGEFSQMKTGINIEEFETHPYKYKVPVDQKKIKIKKNGTVSKKELIKWYRLWVLTDYAVWEKEAVKPVNHFHYHISNFYNLDNFIQSLEELEIYLEVKFDFSRVKELYSTLHNTLTYDIESIYKKPTCLLETYNLYLADRISF